MQVIISWRHREPVQSVEDYINKKMTHLEKFSHRISSSTVVLTQEGARTMVELKIKLDGAPNFLVKDESYKFREAIDSCISKAERIVSQYEKKVRNKKQE
jgi:ribosomal subunit interface protein